MILSEAKMDEVMKRRGWGQKGREHGENKKQGAGSRRQEQGDIPRHCDCIPVTWFIKKV